MKHLAHSSPRYPTLAEVRGRARFLSAGLGALVLGSSALVGFFVAAPAGGGPATPFETPTDSGPGPTDLDAGPAPVDAGPDAGTSPSGGAPLEDGGI